MKFDVLIYRDLGAGVKDRVQVPQAGLVSSVTGS